MAPRLLLVEDDERLAELVVASLSKAGYMVSHSASGIEGEALMRAGGFELVLLDGHLPDKDGFDVLRDVRRDFAGRIVMLTARDDDIDQVMGLEGGADDYITKPVSPRVLLARIKTLLRREPLASAQSPAGDSAELRFDVLLIKPAARSVTVDEKEIELTTAEFDLLLFLAERAGSVVSRDDIMQGLRGLEFDGLDRAIDARISRLRRKLGAAERIKTVRAQGYLFAKD
ncbi:response regulator transcription factor [Paucibacter oligotrophus]|uniref:Response regulator transcription factor n=1 Tax=Roseateles oligotrophus TaxID=1769250 RepID=A0ABT2YJP0_9BURK|nr:response regulator transcription factor [Roseateles oligotrophus]MCV2370282.1 response regulator transcription factor [Roseateles oligotrophus]